MSKHERLIQNLGKILGEINEIEIGKLNGLDTRLTDVMKKIESLSGKLDILESHIESLEKFNKITKRMESLSEKFNKDDLLKENK